MPSNSVLPRVNPWDVDPAVPTEQSGWANFDNFESTLNIAGVLKVGDTEPTSQEAFATPINVAAGLETAIPSVPVIEAAVPLESASNAEAPATPVVEPIKEPVEIHSTSKTTASAEAVEKIESAIPTTVVVEQELQIAVATQEQKVPQVNAIATQPTATVEEPQEEKAPIKTETTQETAGQSANVTATSPAIPEVSNKAEETKTTKAETVKSETTTKVDESEKPEKPLTML